MQEFKDECKIPNLVASAWRPREWISQIMIWIGFGQETFVVQTDENSHRRSPRWQKFRNTTVENIGHCPIWERKPSSCSFVTLFHRQWHQRFKGTSIYESPRAWSVGQGSVWGLGKWGSSELRLSAFNTSCWNPACSVSHQ
jgi:hypothetical protein